MKALIKEQQTNQGKKIFITVDRPDYDFTKVKLILTDDFGWAVKYSIFGIDVLTATELREIARKLDEYNQNKSNLKKWKLQKNSKNQ